MPHGRPSVSAFELPFKLDLTNLVDNQHRSIPFAFPLAPFDSGSWSIAYACSTTGIDRTLTCSITWRGCRPSAAVMSARLFEGTKVVDEKLQVGPSNADYGPSTQLHVQKLFCTWIVGRPATVPSMELRLRVQGDATSPAETLGSAELAERHTPLVSAPQPHDVRFFFPRSDRELWANSSMLAAASPYWASLFESEFKESVKEAGSTEESPVSSSTSTLGGSQRSADDDEAVYFEDSDDEIDELQAYKRDSSAPHPSKFHPLTIHSIAFTTMRAILIWLHSTHIAFAPMLSSFSPDDYSSRDEARLDRNQMIKDYAAEHPSLPLPSSPKSIYRAAHLLELPKLKQLALKSIKSQLKGSSVAYELLGDVATCYEEVRDVEMEFAVEHWTELVRDSTAMNEMQTLAETGQLPGAAATLIRLARRLNT